MAKVTNKQTSTQPSKGFAVLRAIWLLISLALIGSTSVAAAYYWKQTTTLQKQVSSLETTKKLQETDIARLRAQPPAPAESPTSSPSTISLALPDGKTLSYPLTPANSQVLLWANTDNGIVVSHQKVIDFVAGLPTETRKAVCGNDIYFSAKDIQLGFLNSKTKTLTRTQSTNCLQAMANASLNKDKPSQQKAKTTLDEVTNDIETFLKAATIQ